MRIFGFIVVLVTGALLISATNDLPDWGDPGSPANSGETSTFFIQNTEQLTDVPNLVTAVLADYRGYDTMFETVVIFAAGLAIMAILTGLGLPRQRDTSSPPLDPIIQTTCRILVPVIQLFGLYVIAHGHHSPGGGFQGGVILGASFILLALSQNLESALERLSERRFLMLAAVGIIIYAAHGVVAQFFGGNLLDYTYLSHLFGMAPDAPVEAHGRMSTWGIQARYWAMLGVEIGVAFTVCAIMFAIFANLASRGAMKKGL